jgi:type VI secretion system secreted protein VgrG
MRRLRHPLNPKAVKAANAAIGAETGGRPLTMEPEDAALREKWIDAYLAAGGEEEKPDSRNVKENKQNCPNKNWVELQYLYVTEQGEPPQLGVRGAKYIVKNRATGAIVAQGKLDQNGYARVDGLPDGLYDITYYFDNDPPSYSIFDQYRPKKNLLVKPPAEYIERAARDHVLQEVDGWGWGVVEQQANGDSEESTLDWWWGVLQGDFNKNPTFGQILANTIITLIPVVDTVGDIRDVIANIIVLCDEDEKD